MLNQMNKGKVAKTAALLAAAGILVYAIMEMTKDQDMVPVAPAAVGAARFPPPAQISRPISTPTMLASKNGLGGGAFVNSQSLKLGGSAFKPGRKVTYRQYGFQTYEPWPLLKPSAPAAPEPPPVPPAATVDPSAAAAVDVSATMAPVAPPDAPVAPAPPASMTPLAASSAPMKRRSAPFGGSVIARARFPTDVIVDSRDGMIVQPRA